MSVNLADYPTLVSYAILAQSGITTVDTTTVNDGYYGNAGGPSQVTGPFVATGSPSGENNAAGTILAANNELSALVLAIQAITPVTVIGTTFSGVSVTYLPGQLYQSASSLTYDTGTDITFDAEGDTEAQFFINAATGGISFSNITINLVGGAQACNIFWLAGTAITFTTVPQVYGFLIGGSAVTFTTTPLINSHVYAQGSAVSITGTTLIDAACPVICYRKGTQVLTESGYQPIEDLRAGDRVVTKGTLHDNRHVVLHASSSLEPVRWVGSFTVKNPTSVSRPIRISAGALGSKVPSQDLYVSPGHRIIVDGFMVCARDLVNGTTIIQEISREEVEYYHLELDTHSAILANGVVAETFLDLDSRVPPRSRAEIPPSVSVTTTC